MNNIEAIVKLDNDLIICDIGASKAETVPFFSNLLKSINYKLYGFEPNPEEFKKLVADKKNIFFNTAVGDGSKKKLNICKVPGASSFLEPDFNVLKFFPGFETWYTVIDQIEVNTTKLDDAKFDEKIDLIKIDVQGYESEIIKHGKNVIKNALCVIVETSVVPLYKNGKPAFEISRQMNDLGFILHGYANIDTRSFKPMFVKDEHARGINHIVQFDECFIKDFRKLELLDDESIKKLIIIMFYTMNSYDLVAMLIMELDKRLGTKLIEKYSSLNISKTKTKY